MAQNQKLGPATDRGQTGQRAALSAARAALEESRKCGRTGAKMPVLWARDCPPGPLSPGAYTHSEDSFLVFVVV